MRLYTLQSLWTVIHYSIPVLSCNCVFFHILNLSLRGLSPSIPHYTRSTLIYLPDRPLWSLIWSRFLINRIPTTALTVGFGLDPSLDTDAEKLRSDPSQNASDEQLSDELSHELGDRLQVKYYASP